MNVWFVMYRKEWLELVRSYKLIWIPIVFLLIGASQPVMTYFLPDIIANAGNMPAGTVIEMPTPQAPEVMAQTLGQFGMLGLLVLALACMGAVSQERTSGTAAMVLVKPVSYLSFVTSKWAALMTLTVLSFSAGYCASWYYTNVLFAAVSWQAVLGSLLLFALWLIFVGTVTVLFSAWLRSAAATAFSALAVAVVLNLTASLAPKLFVWSPGRLSELASAQAMSGQTEGVWLVVAVSVGGIILLLGLSVLLLRSHPSLEAAA
ncbi:ABC transporter permease [Paenibacillus sp. GCM10027626]|uniref:ABC transporter permease n=1 Tax=Paenibacillus sp. GCM10027626 TaxID=3273411 RepID=UPI0036338BA4